MSGYGVSGGAVSIINAVATGFGAAYGISLSTKAMIKESDIVTLRINGKSAAPAFAEALFSRFIAYTKADNVDISGAEIAVESDIPPSVGLKSSSAAANAILLALCDETGVSLSSDVILRIGAQASVDAKVSITGAYDDAAACLFGGAVFTDNTQHIVLKRVLMPENLECILVIPKQGVVSSAFPKERLNAERSLVAFECARCGDIEDIFVGIVRNSVLIAEALGISHKTVEDAIRCGAKTAGISGTGCAVGILVEKTDLSEFLNRFTPYLPPETSILRAQIRNWSV